MYPLTIGLAIENRELWEQTQSCLSDLPFRIIVEHQDIGDVSNFLDRLERMRPDVVLIDISGWREPLEGIVTSIRAAIGDPMIIALNVTADSDSILASMRAGINEYLYPPLRDPLRRALEKRAAERSRRRDSGAKTGGKSFAFFSAKGGCGATTLVTHVAAELGRQNQKVLLADLDLDSGMVGFITKTTRSTLVCAEKCSGTACHLRPQKRFMRETSTTAFEWPISAWLKGCRTQFVGETTSPSINVTSNPPGWP